MSSYWIDSIICTANKKLYLSLLVKEPLILILLKIAKLRKTSAVLSFSLILSFSSDPPSHPTRKVFPSLAECCSSAISLLGFTTQCSMFTTQMFTTQMLTTQMFTTKIFTTQLFTTRMFTTQMFTTRLFTTQMFTT